MASVFSEIDIRESYLKKRGRLLDILLLDKTTKKNIIWATDSYINYGKKFFSETKEIKSELITGNYSKLIQPRASKTIDEQKKRTREKAEVFTPLKIVDQMNKSIDAYSQSSGNWKDYIKEIKLEITCGEAPFIVTRYNPISNGKLLNIKNRVGFLDRKLKMVNKFCKEKEDWIFWSK